MRRGSLDAAGRAYGDGACHTGVHAFDEQLGDFQGVLSQHFPLCDVGRLSLRKEPQETEQVVAHLQVSGRDHGDEGLTLLVVGCVLLHFCCDAL